MYRKEACQRDEKELIFSLTAVTGADSTIYSAGFPPFPGFYIYTLLPDEKSRCKGDILFLFKHERAVIQDCYFQPLVNTTMNNSGQSVERL